VSATATGSGPRSSLERPGGHGGAAAAVGGAADEDPFTTVLLIDQPHLDDDECVTSISWGGGAACTMSAATKQSVCLVSLAPFFDEWRRQQQQQQPPPRHGSPTRAGHNHHHPHAAAAPLCVAMPSSLHAKLDVYRSRASVLAHQWTHDGRGLLISDAKGGMVMLQVEEEDDGGGSSRVRELWQVHADAPQDLIAAGATAAGPCASVVRDSPQRVVVWWPSRGDKDGQYEVGAEVIRHPVKTVHLEWSPALGREGGGGSGAERQSPGGSPSAAAAAAAAGAAAADQQLEHQQPQSPAAAAAAAASRGPEADPPRARHPALMTVGSDGVIRVFVEVVMADIDDMMSQAAAAAAAANGSSGGGALSPTKQAAAAAAATAAPARVLSQFCLTLAVEPPPGHGIAPGALPGLTATWARPMAAGRGGTTTTDPQQGAPRVLWLLASYCAPPPAPPPQPHSPQALPQSPTRGPGGAQPAPPPAARGAPEWVDSVFLWAIDGLSGVVLRGIAQNAITASKLSVPRAFLWGGDAAAPRWRRPGALAAAGAQQSLAAWLHVGAGGVPLMQCSQQFEHAQSG
jgi:hypothetical protein